MIVVTGGRGQIGGALVRRLLSQGQKVFVVEHERHTDNSIQDVNCIFFPYKDAFLEKFEELHKQYKFTAVLHQGAISSTTASDKELLQKNNVEYSIKLIELCRKKQIYLSFASSASVYGNNKDNFESPVNEDPLNDYAASKLEVDRYIFSCSLKSDSNQLIDSLRYFNVCGPDELHKLGQCSPFLTYLRSLLKNGSINILSGDDGTGLNANQYSRDFIYVEDVVDVVLWFMENKDGARMCGSYNVGTGETNTFLSVAKACQKIYSNRQKDIQRAGFPFHHFLEVNCQKFPDHLKGKSQPYTKADITKLRAIGYDKPFTDIEQLANNYLTWLLDNKDRL